MFKQPKDAVEKNRTEHTFPVPEWVLKSMLVDLFRLINIEGIRCCDWLIYDYFEEFSLQNQKDLIDDYIKIVLGQGCDDDDYMALLGWMYYKSLNKA